MTDNHKNGDMKMKTENYSSPELEILLVRTEQGVAFSQDWYLEDFGDGGEI